MAMDARICYVDRQITKFQSLWRTLRENLMVLGAENGTGAIKMAFI